MKLIIDLQVATSKINGLRRGAVGILELDVVHCCVKDLDHPLVDERHSNAAEINHNREGDLYLFRHCLECFSA